MNIKVNDIKNVKYVNLLGLVRLLIAVVLACCPIVVNNTMVDFIAVVASFIMINCSKLLDFRAVCFMVIMQAYSSDDRSLCPTCSTPIAYYGFKLSLRPNTIIVYYACGTERTITIKEDKDDKSYEVVSNEITKHGTCYAETNEDVI